MTLDRIPVRAAPGDRGAAARRTISTVLSWLVLLAGGAVVLAHFGLITGGSWGADEYVNFNLWRIEGVRAVIVRVLGWSPRPSSELALYLYSLAIEASQKPLITPFLAVAWLSLIGSAVLASRRPYRPGVLSRGAVVATVLALFLLGHQTFMIFYWPMGVAPYMLTLLGILVVTFQTIGSDAPAPQGRPAWAIGLAIAGTSSELGMFFVIGYAGCLILLDGRRFLRNGAPTLRSAAWYLVPLGITLLMIGLIIRVVLTDPTRGLGHDSPYHHHLGASAVAAFRFFFHQFAIGDDTPGGLDATDSLIVSVLMVVGFAWGTRSAVWGRFRPRLIVPLLSGLLACYWIGLFASYYEYGTQEHEPHIGFRRCLSVLIVLVLARLAAAVWETRVKALQVIGPAALLAALTIGGVARSDVLLEDYRAVPVIRAARDATWESARDPTSDILQFHVAVPGGILSGAIPFPPGVFDVYAPDTPWWMKGIMIFFDKPQLEFTLMPTGRIWPPVRKGAGT
ncbi:MAG: hypothetical protein BGO51_24635 [Rhodospirillales bacterium 69-11]|nr:MAG: hypothetical protein BGO51_24635 [Rhodospirillales bacterium 69-11]